MEDMTTAWSGLGIERRAGCKSKAPAQNDLGSCPEIVKTWITAIMASLEMSWAHCKCCMALCCLPAGRRLASPAPIALAHCEATKPTTPRAAARWSGAVLAEPPGPCAGRGSEMPCTVPNSDGHKKQTPTRLVTSNLLVIRDLCMPWATGRRNASIHKTLMSAHSSPTPRASG